MWSGSELCAEAELICCPFSLDPSSPRLLFLLRMDKEKMENTLIEGRVGGGPYFVARSFNHAYVLASSSGNVEEADDVDVGDCRVGRSSSKPPEGVLDFVP